MESFWTKKAEANQNHIQAYLIETRFDEVVEERGLREQFNERRSEGSYSESGGEKSVAI